MPWPSLTSAPPAPATLAGPWPQLPATAAGGQAAWPPAASVAVSGTDTAGPESEPARPVFDEAEVARLTAAAAAAAALEATEAARRQVAAREATALERLATELVLAREAKLGADRAARGQFALIGTAITRALLPRLGENPERALAIVTAMLDGLPPITGARLIVDPSTAAALEGRLPTLAQRAGYPIALEADPMPERAPGSMRLVWDGGWADHDPGEIGRQIVELLAAHAAPQLEGDNDDGE